MLIYSRNQYHIVKQFSSNYKNVYYLLSGFPSKVSLVAKMVKNLPAMQETQVRFLSQEDPLEKEMATHSSVLACRIPWTEEPGRLQSMRSQESNTT